MYVTTFVQGNNGLKGIVHDFGYEVRVVTDLDNNVIRRMHGSIVVKEWTADMRVVEYERLLLNIENEIEKELGEQIGLVKV